MPTSTHYPATDANTVYSWMEHHPQYLSGALQTLLQAPQATAVAALQSVLKSSKLSDVWRDINGKFMLSGTFINNATQTYTTMAQNQQNGGGNGGGPQVIVTGGSTAPTPPNYANYIGEYKKWLQDHDIKIDKNLQNLMNNAAHQKQGSQFAPMTLDQFIVAVRDTKEYHQRFIGIFDKGGSLSMTEDQYLQQEKDYQSYAADAGVNLSHKDIGRLFKNDVSVHEFIDRAQAVGVLQRNGQYFDAFKQELKAMGVKHTPTEKGLLDWIMSKGESNKEWTVLWDTASARYQAQQGGLQTSLNKKASGDMNLTQAQLKQIGALVDSAQKSGGSIPGSMTQLADVLQQDTLATARAGAWGLSKQDLIEMEFGGTRSAAARQKLADLQQFEQNADKTTYGTAGVGQQQAQTRLASQRRAQQGY